MKRAVSSMDACAWGVRQQGSDKEVVRLKRCKSAFANLKQLAASSGTPSIFATEDRATAAESAATMTMGKDQQHPTRCRRFFDQHDGPAPEPSQQQQPGELRLDSRGVKGRGGNGPFVFGSTWPASAAEQAATAAATAAAACPQRYAPMRAGSPPAAAATERRLFVSGNGSSSSSNSGGTCPTGGGGGGSVGVPPRRHNSFASSSFNSCSTVHEQQAQEAADVDAVPLPAKRAERDNSGAAPLCPFLQRQHEDDEREAGGLAAPIEAASLSSGGGPSVSNPALTGRLGFSGWLSDSAGGAGSSPGFSIVGFGVEVDDDVEAEEDKPDHHRHHRCKDEEGEEDEEQGSVLSESPSSSPMLLLRLQRRFEEILLVN